MYRNTEEGDQQVPDRDYQEARNLSLKIATDLGSPRFYQHNDKEVARSQQLFDLASMVRDCLGVVAGCGDCYGHGLSHSRKVAIDAGAIILVEVSNTPLRVEAERLVLLAHLAGLLHDIKRAEKDHARMGAREAARILKDFPLEDRECSAIAQAIANHEAFQADDKLDEPESQLLSDALYDADKFRWGPDNFTDTLWAMLASRRAPLSAALPRFLTGLEGIRKIRETFRTSTGKLYGPDFIDRGLEIGKRFYKEIMQKG